MNSLLANGVFPLIVVIAFVAIVLFVESAYLIWNTYKGPTPDRPSAESVPCPRPLTDQNAPQF